MSLRGMSGFPANPRIRHQVARGALVLIGLTAPWPTMDGRAQDARTVWSGVSTTAQAGRGQLVYEGQCSRCHGNDLGGNRASPLAGERFMDHWDAHTLQQLFRRIRDTMPPSDAGTLSPADARDLVAYVLQQNGFPAGSAELAHDERELLAVQITGKTGPSPLKTGAVVRVAGCLAQVRERDWELTGAAAPEKTTLEASRQSEAVARGTRTIRLLNPFPNPSAHVGHTMQAIGFLVQGAAVDQDAAVDAVNVVSLEMLTPTCER
jgi:S-disulfanyl-L-cysteine oxidoreductase SoxD